MSFPGLTIIGERLNPGFASSKKMLDARDLPGLQELARSQVAKGAPILNLNCGIDGERDPGFVVEVLRAVQAVVDVPICIDSPAAQVQAAALPAYDPAKARGRAPILNSITENRWELLALRRCEARVLFMVSERSENGQPTHNRSVPEIVDTTRRVIARAKAEQPGMTNDHCIIGVSVAPLATDMDGLTKLAVDSIAALHACPDLRGIHMSVGLSNIGIMLPKKEVAGLPIGLALECAFLTCCVPFGLDMSLATAGRAYTVLSEDHPAMIAFREILTLEGGDALRRLRKLYAGTAVAEAQTAVAGSRGRGVDGCLTLRSFPQFSQGSHPLSHC